jgi:hypothetical protein
VARAYKVRLDEEKATNIIPLRLKDNSYPVQYGYHKEFGGNFLTEHHRI